MFTANDNEKLQTLMAQSPENEELIQKLLNAHQFTLSKISHEIRNPLTLVYSGLQLIQTQHPEVKEFKHWTQVIEDVVFMNQLLDDLSMYNNGQRLTRREFDFLEFMKHLVISFATSLVNTDIEFASDLSPSLTNITGDKTKLQEVFLNLLKNSRDAVGTKGKIVLAACAEDEHITITVSDNGNGIPEPYINSIFAPFTTYKAGGTGLGLAVAQKTVMAHGGSIMVESSEGIGTKFTVTLPV